MPGSGTLRPQSAPVAARSIYVGATAKPAGLAGFMGAGFVTAYDRRPTLREQHALHMASMYAEVTGPGYKAREAAVQPSWRNVGAGEGLRHLAPELRDDAGVVPDPRLHPPSCALPTQLKQSVLGEARRGKMDR